MTSFIPTRLVAALSLALLATTGTPQYPAVAFADPAPPCASPQFELAIDDCQPAIAAGPRPIARASQQTRAAEAASQLVSLIHGERALHGLATFLITDALVAVAHVRAGELVRRLSHDRPTRTLEDLLEDVGLAWRLLGENIARIEGGTPAEAAARAHRQFMRRDAHAANVLSSDFVYLGVDATEAGGRYYFALVFAR